MTFFTNYIESTRYEFQRYRILGDKTFEQLSENDMHWSHSQSDNSIAIIVKHLAGNMLSRWTNFLSEDGEKKWRERDNEFIAPPKTKAETIVLWDKGWDCLFDAVRPLKHDQLEQIVYIRNQGHTVTEALNRQLAHYASHVGQLMFLGKMIKDKDWQSLSIPKGKSSSYNKEKFSQEKERKHFTDDL